MQMYTNIEINNMLMKNNFFNETASATYYVKFINFCPIKHFEDTEYKPYQLLW